jgi:hypothetical protein
MTDIPFTSFAFPATGAPTGRTMPARLNDVINVKDWGAQGNGTHDDTAAIQAAIYYAYSLNSYPIQGATVFIPKGTYLITRAIDIASNRAPHYTGCVKLIGAGRDATILRGSLSSDCILHQAYHATVNIDVIADMTVQNDSTAFGSGAINITGAVNSTCISNCHLIGVVGINMWWLCFNGCVRDCLFTCNIPTKAANDYSWTLPTGIAGDGSKDGSNYINHSIGLYAGQGCVINCHAIGFDVGFAVSGPGTTMMNCSASRCGIGVYAGLAPAGAFSGNALNFNLLGCRLDRCLWGIYVGNGGPGTFASNIISGTQGPPGAAAIQDMHWDNVSKVVTVTTTVAHNLPAGNSGLVLRTNNPAWTPDGSGDQVIWVTRDNSTQFHYGGPRSDPGAFTGGDWNYSPQYAIVSHSPVGHLYAANIMSARVSHASFNAGNNDGLGIQCTCMSMRGPYGWVMPTLDNFMNSWHMFMCGMAGKRPPVSFHRLSQLGSGSDPKYRDEYNVNDAATQPSWGGVVTSGGSNHYKIRSDGTKWIRIG